MIEIHFALSALKHPNERPWAAGPGFHSSRPWRFYLSRFHPTLTLIPRGNRLRASYSGSLS